MSYCIKFNDASFTVAVVAAGQKYDFPVLDASTFSAAFIQANQLMDEQHKLVMWAPRRREKLSPRTRYQQNRRVIDYLADRYDWMGKDGTWQEASGKYQNVLNQRTFLQIDVQGQSGEFYVPHWDNDPRRVVNGQPGTFRQAIHTQTGYGTIAFPFAELTTDDFEGRLVKPSAYKNLGAAFAAPAGGAIFMVIDGSDQIAHCAPRLINNLPCTNGQGIGILRETDLYCWRTINPNPAL